LICKKRFQQVSATLNLLVTEAETEIEKEKYSQRQRTE